MDWRQIGLRLIHQPHPYTRATKGRTHYVKRGWRWPRFIRHWTSTLPCFLCFFSLVPSTLHVSLFVSILHLHLQTLGPLYYFFVISQSDSTFVNAYTVVCSQDDTSYLKYDFDDDPVIVCIIPWFPYVSQFFLICIIFSLSPGNLFCCTWCPVVAGNSHHLCGLAGGGVNQSWYTLVLTVGGFFKLVHLSV